jgi:hypothetical protein
MISSNLNSFLNCIVALFLKGKTAEQLFLESAIGICIMQHINPENIDDATRLYLSDFVHFSHKTQTDREEMVIYSYSILVLIVTGTITDVPQTSHHLVSGVIIVYVIENTALIWSLNYLNKKKCLHMGNDIFIS